MGVLCDNRDVDFLSSCRVEESIRDEDCDHTDHKNGCPPEHYANASLMGFAPCGPNRDVAENQRADEKEHRYKDHRQPV